MSNTWTNKLRERETGKHIPPLPAIPQPNTGAIILDEQLKIDSLPGRLLDHVIPSTAAAASARPIHYMDLGRIQVKESLLEFGGSDDLWAGVIKLYASGCGLKTIDGVSRLTSCKYLYLDNNLLPKGELLRLVEELPNAEIVALDFSNNPGMDEQVENALLECPALASCQYFNGERVGR